MRIMALMLALALALCLVWTTNRTRDPAVASALSQLDRKMHLLLAHLQKHHPGDDRTLRLAYGWDGRLQEQTGTGAGATVNKRTISLCVRDAGGMLQDPDTAAFILMHEIAHICTVSEGHTQEFWGNFKFLLKAAVAAGIYRYQRFEKQPVTYCGSTISHSPLTCVVDGSCT